MIVGFCGRKNSGKDICANILKKSLIETGMYDKVATLAFADHIKEQLANMFSIDIDNFYNQSCKDKC